MVERDKPQGENYTERAMADAEKRTSEKQDAQDYTVKKPFFFNNVKRKVGEKLTLRAAEAVFLRLAGKIEQARGKSDTKTTDEGKK